MILTRKADYAVRSVLHLAKAKDFRASMAEISRKRLVPKSLLAKIMQKLAHVGIVESVRGAGGGFRLLKKPSEIGLFEVITAIDGPMALNRCTADEKECPLSNACAVHTVWIEMQKEMESRLKAVTFGSLMTA